MYAGTNHSTTKNQKSLAWTGYTIIVPRIVNKSSSTKPLLRMVWKVDGEYSDSNTGVRKAAFHFPHHPEVCQTPLPASRLSSPASSC
jgi:hypothetical protein